MAFNPFHAFRRHQKVIFAILTIVAMVTFIFCSGVPGTKDFFLESIPEWVGLRTRARTITELYGHRITDLEIAQAREQRMVGRQAVATGFMIALRKLDQEEQEVMRKQDSPDRVTRLGDLQTKRQKIEAAQLAFFLTPGGEGIDDLLDYMVWKHEAERLGITFTPKDVDEQLRNFTERYAGVPEIAEQLAAGNRFDRSRYRREAIEAGVAALLRTELARSIVLEANPATKMSPSEKSMLLRQLQFGQIPPQFLSFFLPETGPLAVTPFEFRNFMAEKRTEVDIGLFRVPVKPDPKAPLDTVAEQYLKQLYERYRDVESSPDSARPGFKEPRRIAVEWIGATPSDDYWTERAGKVLPALPPSLSVLAGTSSAVKTGPFPILGQLIAADSRAQQAYENVKGDYQYGRSAWHVGQWDLPIFTAKTNPRMVLGLWGGLSGASATGGSLLNAVLEFQHRALNDKKDIADGHAVVTLEAPNRAPFAVTTILSGTNPTPFARAALWFHEDKRPAHLPLKSIRSVVEKSMRTEIAKNLVIERLREFRKELEKEAATGPKQAQELIDKTLKEPWVSLHARMKEPRDQRTLGTDLALAEMRKTFDTENPFDTKGERFAETFFNATGGVFVPHPLPDDQPFFTGSTQSRWTAAAQPFVWWKTEDKPAFVPTFEQARERVEAAWRLAQARLPARKEAETLLAKVKEAAGDKQKLLQLAAERKDDPMIELNSVARLVPMPVAAGPSRPEPYKFPDTIRANTLEWLDKILSLSRKGDAVLLKDLSEENYYVVVALSDPKPPSADEVARAFRTGSTGMTADPLLRDFLRERQAKYREAVLKELRLAAVGAKGLEADGRYKLDAEFRKDNRDDGLPVEGG